MRFNSADTPGEERQLLSWRKKLLLYTLLRNKNEKKNAKQKMREGENREIFK
jgi:hypothetical protein